MGLLQVASSVVTSSTASVSLTGIDSDDVYMLAVNNFVPVTDAQDMKIRVIESGTPNSTANYDIAAKLLRADTTFGNDSNTNDTSFDCSTAIGNDTGECANWIFYIYNANNSSEFTFFTQETVQLAHTALLIGRQGGCVFTSASQVEGIQMFAGSGNIQSGTFTLYKVV
tara:strand:- start:2760 stop:3266 length:507 start_codon:yes stop_codon:yes gene_type:complete